MGKTRPYRDLLLERLSDPEVAQHYLNDALEESLDAFLRAVTTVAEARKTSSSLARTCNDADPTIGALSSVLRDAGLKLSISVIDPVSVHDSQALARTSESIARA